MQNDEVIWTVSMPVEDLGWVMVLLGLAMGVAAEKWGLW